MEQYINKAAVVAEIEERRDSLISLSESCPANTTAKSGFYAQAQTLEGIKNFIETLEVKEVDLNRESAWKPSGEQMEALADALSLAKSCGEERAFDLRTLYEQLEKLKGE